MRKHGRVDDTQREIVAVLRGYGATVQSLASIGGGVPDLLIGWRGQTHLVELKDGTKPPSAQQLTEAEADWIERWTGGPVAILRSAAEAEQWLRTH